MPAFKAILTELKNLSKKKDLKLLTKRTKTATQHCIMQLATTILRFASF